MEAAVAMARSRPTSADVAARAGVSRTTVSFVLNDRTDVQIPDDTRQRVFRAASELGYHPHTPARQLAAGRSNVLGLVLRQSAEQVAGDATLAETLRGLASAARAAGSRVMVEPLAPEGTYDRLLRSHQADGLIVSGPRTDDPSLAQLAGDGFPVVLQGSHARPRCPERRHRQRGRGGRGRRPSAVARPPPDRLHHQCAAGLHRGRRTAARLPAGARGSRRRLRRGAGRGRCLRRGERRTRRERPARADHLYRPVRRQRRRSPSAPSTPCAKPIGECPTTCRSWASTTSRWRPTSIRR